MCETKVSKPKATDRSRVICAMIRYPGPCVNIRLMTKKIRNMGTKLVKGKSNIFMHVAL